MKQESPLGMGSVKNVLIHERECVTRASTEGCDRNCKNCDLVLPEEDIIEAYDLAILAIRLLIVDKEHGI